MDGCLAHPSPTSDPMHDTVEQLAEFLESVPPYEHLTPEERLHLARQCSRLRFGPGEAVYQLGEPLPGVYILKSGEVETSDEHGVVVSRLAPRSTFGERGLLRDGRAATTATSTQTSVVLQLPAAEFRRLLEVHPHVQRFFLHSSRTFSRSADFSTQRVSDLIARAPLHCAPSTSVGEAARLMREHHVSSLGIIDDGSRQLVGILTIRDLANRVLAEGRDASTPVHEVMSPIKAALTRESLGSDVLRMMVEHKVGHLPVVERGQFVGMITQPDLTRFQATNAASVVKDIADATEIGAMARAAARI